MCSNDIKKIAWNKLFWWHMSVHEVNNKEWIFLCISLVEFLMNMKTTRLIPEYQHFNQSLRRNLFYTLLNRFFIFNMYHSINPQSAFPIYYAPTRFLSASITNYGNFPLESLFQNCGALIEQGCFDLTPFDYVKKGCSLKIQLKVSDDASIPIVMFLNLQNLWKVSSSTLTCRSLPFKINVLTLERFYVTRMWILSKKIQQSSVIYFFHLFCMRD